MTPPAPRFYQRALDLAAAAPKRTDAALLARVTDAGTGEIFIYDTVGADPWAGGGITAKDVATALDGMRRATALNSTSRAPAARSMRA